MTPEEIEALTGALAAAMREAVKDIGARPQQLLFTAEEAGELTSLPANWWEQRARDGLIPVTRPAGQDGKPGKYVRFSLEQIERTVHACELEPTSGLMARLAARDAAARRPVRSTRSAA